MKQYQKSIGICIAILFEIYIGIGIGNTFFKVYWYWYCQYFLKVLLTTLVKIHSNDAVSFASAVS